MKKETNKIGRVVIVHPSQGETFDLLLLHHKSGAFSFGDLRTVNGHVWETFKQCCKLSNLLQDDNEWFDCLNEAIQSPASLRGLFVTIFTFL